MPIPVIWDKPITIWLGIAVITCLFATATLGFVFHRRLVRFPFAWHRRMALVTIILAVVHASFVFYAYFL